jgi:hypothetical protein
MGVFVIHGDLASGTWSRPHRLPHSNPVGTVLLLAAGPTIGSRHCTKPGARARA